jgi:hypothetical protein
MNTRLTPVTIGLAAVLFGCTIGPACAENLSNEFLTNEQMSLMHTAGQKDGYLAPTCADPVVPMSHCGGGPVFYSEIEALALRYSRGDGLTNNLNDPNARFDDGDHFVPRLTTGMVLSSGLGARIRYLDVDLDESNGNGDLLRVEARVFDLELFENTRLTSCSAIEWSLGFRYSDFSESINPHPLFGNDVLRSEIEGYGIVAGFEVNRLVRWGSFYGRGRGALLIGDRTIDAPGIGLESAVQRTVTPGMFELAAGWEISHVCHNGMVLTAGIGWEVQRWFGHSTTATAATSSLPSPADIGFHGAVLNFAVGF